MMTTRRSRQRVSVFHIPAESTSVATSSSSTTTATTTTSANIEQQQYKQRQRTQLNQSQQKQLEQQNQKKTETIEIELPKSTAAATATSALSPKDWENIEIKEEKLDEDEFIHDDDDDAHHLAFGQQDEDDGLVDVQKLQQEILRQQKQLQQQQQLPQAQQQVQLAQTTITLPASAATSQGPVFILGDLNSLRGLKKCFPLTTTSPTTTSSATVTIPKTSSPINLNLNGKSNDNINFAASINGTAPSTASKNWEKDDFDLQESDLDEDGFSDADLEDEDEVIEDFEDVYDPTWTPTQIASRKIFRFEQSSSEAGLNGRPKSTLPKFYFNYLLGNADEFFQQLANGCNQRAQKLLAATNTANIPMNYQHITANDMQIFFALCLQMASMKFPTLSDYWKSTPLMGSTGFRRKMTFERFELLLKLLNFDQLKIVGLSAASDTSIMCQESLGDFKSLIYFFNARMESIYNCGQRLVINDPLVFWKGHILWYKNMNEKFRENSIFLHCLSEQTGLVLKIIADVQRKEAQTHVRNSKLLVMHRAKLAKDLLKEKLGKGHTVYVSKFYGSYALALELLNSQTYCSGLLDKKRYGNSKQLILDVLDTSSFATTYASSIMMGKCHRREKSIYFYSSDCLAIYAKEINANRRNGDVRPKLVKELDWQLAGTTMEQLLRYQLDLKRYEIKWDKQLIVFIFNMMIYNAYILYQTHGHYGRVRVLDSQNMKSYEDFRQDIIESLLKGNDTSSGDFEDELEKSKIYKKQKLSTTQESQFVVYDRLINSVHVPTIFRQADGGKVMKKRCRICRRSGLLAFTKTCCELCPGKPGLCETPCFKIWHDQLHKSLETGQFQKPATIKLPVRVKQEPMELQ